MLGVLSLLERVLLASVQFRHGPGSAIGNGLSLLLADGCKLYAKQGGHDRLVLAPVFVSALAFVYGAWLLAWVSSAGM
jgi:NADH:ubiquinone oxidoreductase subunit H